MPQFYCIDLPEFSQGSEDVSSACVCCLVKDCSLVNIINCRHGFILEKITTFKIYLPTVCNKCHGFLEKINVFMQQVENSQKILLDNLTLSQKKCKPNIKGTYSLDNKDCVSDSTLSQFEERDNFKAEPLSNDECLADDRLDAIDIIDDDIKKNVIKNESSDSDSGTPLSVLRTCTKERGQSKSRNKTSDKRLKSRKRVLHSDSNDTNVRIKVIHLTEEQMKEERLKDAQRPAYIKFRYKCHNCIVGFDHQQNFDDHMRKHDNKKGGITCEVCSSVLSSKESYQIHVKKHYLRYECKVCGKKYLNRSSTLLHYEETHGSSGGDQKTYKCDQCDFFTTSHRRHRYHAIKHKDRVECEICGNKLVNKCALKVHLLTVHKQSSTQFRCEPCGKLYRARSGLVEHNKAHHAATHAMFYCAECELHFKTEKNLRKHLKENIKHRDSVSYDCRQCDSKFQTQPSLRRHVEFVHKQSVRFDCDQCSKSFASPRGLKKHVDYVHVKKRPPRNKICDYCGRGFMTTQVLRTHIRTHTRERPLRCEHCSATFAHPAALYTHGKIHNKI